MSIMQSYNLLTILKIRISHPLKKDTKTSDFNYNFLQLTQVPIWGMVQRSFTMALA